MCGPSSSKTSSVPISAQQNVSPSLFSGRATWPIEAAFASKMSGSSILLKTVTRLQIITLKMLEFGYHLKKQSLQLQLQNKCAYLGGRMDSKLLWFLFCFCFPPNLCLLVQLLLKNKIQRVCKCILSTKPPLTCPVFNPSLAHLEFLLTESQPSSKEILIYKHCK